MPMSLQHEYQCSWGRESTPPRWSAAPASPRRAAFIRRQLLLQRLDCSLCLNPVWTSHLVLAVHQENLFNLFNSCWVNQNERRAHLCCGKHEEDALPLLRICILSKGFVAIFSLSTECFLSTEVSSHNPVKPIWIEKVLCILHLM